MANKKKTNKKKSTSSSMKNVKRTKNTSKSQRAENLKKIDEIDNSNFDILHIVRVVAIILIIFCAFYFLTLVLTGYDFGSKKSTPISEEETIISYKNIMVGRSFSMPEEDYLVLYYDTSNETLSTSMNTASNGYLAKESHLPLYNVDMADAMNKKYVQEASNPSPTSVSELAINGPTLIHFTNGGVVEYVEGEEAITNYFA